MSNSYVATAFVVTTTKAEAHLARLCFTASELLGDGNETSAHASAILHDPLFAVTYPPLPTHADDPWSGFKTVFEDEDYFGLGCTIEVEPRENGSVDLWIAGHQIQVETVARVLQRSCPSALPLAFEWACYSDRLRRDAFGGGYAIVAADHIQLVTTADLIGRALAGLNGIADEHDQAIRYARSHEADKGRDQRTDVA
ncbi:hypothetical protein [Sphingomonas sp. SUN039]|uniref:hypothetical protein n=1 Tax=Sphingomonas sp. SUN039 TaxID=2937787 RepID=UPI002164D4F0|nr:hypothetical protein [Sphingomonas sp. SUN039]UVO53726.1 hypothetical protein M0209_06175 [Sphingomonas sp. SUN039]